MKRKPKAYTPGGTDTAVEHTLPPTARAPGPQPGLGTTPSERGSAKAPPAYPQTPSACGGTAMPSPVPSGVRCGDGVGHGWRKLLRAHSKLGSLGPSRVYRAGPDKLTSHHGQKGTCRKCCYQNRKSRDSPLTKLLINQEYQLETRESCHRGRPDVPHQPLSVT